MSNNKQDGINKAPTVLVDVFGPGTAQLNPAAVFGKGTRGEAGAQQAADARRTAVPGVANYADRRTK